MPRMTIKIAAAAGFIATILAANYVTSQYGMVPVGFGLMATAGTYFAGLAFILRDLVQDTSGRRLVLALIATGAVLSYAVSNPHIATASAVAFLLSETADFAVYSPLRRKGYVRAAVASNLVGAVVDTIVFLAIAGFPVRQAFMGQLVGKMLITVVVVAAIVLVRTVRRAVPSEPVRG